MAKNSTKRAPRTKKQSTDHSQTAKDTLERRTELAIFTLVAYQMLRADNPKGGGKHKGMHTVWTGHNDAFREFFPDEDPVACQTQFAQEGLISISPFKGGALLQPTLNLLNEPTPEELAIAKRVREFIPGFLVRHAEKKAAYQARKAEKANGHAVQSNKPSSLREKRAHALAASGDIDAAMKKLGFVG